MPRAIGRAATLHPRRRIASLVADGRSFARELSGQSQWIMNRVLQLGCVAAWFATQASLLFCVSSAASIALTCAIYWRIVPVREFQYLAPFNAGYNTGNGGDRPFSKAQPPTPSPSPLLHDTQPPAPSRAFPSSIDGVFVAVAAKYFLDDDDDSRSAPSRAASSSLSAVRESRVVSEAIIDVSGPLAISQMPRGRHELPWFATPARAWRAIARWVFPWRWRVWRTLLPFRSAASHHPYYRNTAAMGGHYYASIDDEDDEMDEGRMGVLAGPAVWWSGDDAPEADGGVEGVRGDGGVGRSLNEKDVTSGRHGDHRRRMLLPGTAYNVAVEIDVPDTPRNRRVLLSSAWGGVDPLGDGGGSRAENEFLPNLSRKWGEAALLEVDLLAAAPVGPVPGVPAAEFNQPRPPSVGDSSRTASGDIRPVLVTPDGRGDCSATVDTTGKISLSDVDASNAPVDGSCGANINSAVINAATTDVADQVDVSTTAPSVTLSSSPAADFTASGSQPGHDGRGAQFVSSALKGPHQWAADGGHHDVLLARCRRPLVVASSAAVVAAAEEEFDRGQRDVGVHARTGEPSGSGSRGILRVLGDVLVAAGGALAGTDIVLTGGTPTRVGASSQESFESQRSQRGAAPAAALAMPLARLSADCFRGGWAESRAVPLRRIRVRLLHPDSEADGFHTMGDTAWSQSSSLSPPPPLLTLLGVRVTVSAELTGLSSLLSTWPLVTGAVLVLAFTTASSFISIGLCCIIRRRITGKFGFGVPLPSFIKARAFVQARTGLDPVGIGHLDDSARALDSYINELYARVAASSGYQQDGVDDGGGGRLTPPPSAAESELSPQRQLDLRGRQLSEVVQRRRERRAASDPGGYAIVAALAVAAASRAAKDVSRNRDTCVMPEASNVMERGGDDMGGALDAHDHVKLAPAQSTNELRGNGTLTSVSRPLNSRTLVSGILPPALPASPPVLRDS